MVVLGTLVVKRVHPVGRGREEEETDIRGLVGVGKEVFCQLCRSILSVQEVLETLEFVENHEVGLQRGDADFRQHCAKLANELYLRLAIVPRDSRSSPPESLTKVLVSLLQIIAFL